MLADAIDIALLAVGLAVLVTYQRRPDGIRPTLWLICGCQTVFFLRDFLQRVFGPMPVWLGDVMLVIGFAQGLMILALLTLLMPGIRPALHISVLAFLVAATLICLTDTPMPFGATLSVIAFAGVLGIAESVLFFIGAMGRCGAARVRLLLAVGEIALFAAALVLSPFGSAHHNLHAPLPDSARIVGLLGALCHAAAMIPPRRLRRLWSAGAGYRLSQRLLCSTTNRVDDTWGCFASLVRTMRGQDAALVLLRSPAGYAEVAGTGIEIDPDAVHPLDEVDELLNMRWTVEMVDGPQLAGVRERAGKRLLTAGAFEVPPDVGGVIVLLSSDHTLFVTDDLALLAELAAQAVLLSERGAVLNAQRELSDRLTSSVLALTTANQAKAEFLSKMSHELRTPLNAIIGFSDLMAREPEAEGVSAVPAEWIGHINGSGRHLLELINDMLDLSKVEAGHIDLRLERLDARAVVESAVAGHRLLLARKKLQLTLHVEQCIVLADRVRLRQILDNLISNAIKFTGEGGHIEVTARRPNGLVEFSVADTGVGIAAADQVRVFEEFQQVGDQAARVGGTGLGLALVRGLAQAHGGSVSVESQLGVGSTFTVRLPAAARPTPSAHGPDGASDGVSDGVAAAGTPDGSGAPDVAPDAAAAGPAVAAGQPGSVLVIEDDPAAVRLLSAYLDDSGYHARVALDGASGLAEARREPPAAILLDVVLPTVDGWEVLRELKLDPRTRGVPVVMVTMLDEQEIGLALGAADYLVKPIDPDVLRGVLRRHAPVRNKPGGVRTALVIDDDPASLELVSVCLGREGVVVQTAGSGAAGLRLARERRFDLIVCDLVMPDVDGFTVIAELQGEARSRGTPVLVVTGQDLAEPDKERLNGEIFGLLRKGEGLEEGMRRWLARAAASGAMASATSGVMADVP